MTLENKHRKASEQNNPNFLLMITMRIINLSEERLQAHSVTRFIVERIIRAQSMASLKTPQNARGQTKTKRLPWADWTEAPLPILRACLWKLFPVCFGKWQLGWDSPGQPEGWHTRIDYAEMGLCGWQRCKAVLNTIANGGHRGKNEWKEGFLWKILQKKDSIRTNHTCLLLMTSIDTT